MAQWHMHYGSWWALQWCWNGWLGLGIHVDWRRGDRMGPYVDFHFAHMIISFGRNPIYTPVEDRQAQNCRGGIFR